MERSSDGQSGPNQQDVVQRIGGKTRLRKERNPAVAGTEFSAGTMERMRTMDDTRTAKQNRKTGKCRTLQAVKSLAPTNGNYNWGVDDSLVVASEHEEGDTTHTTGVWLRG